jgi:hypothetical protein
MRSGADIDTTAAKILNGAIDLHCHSGPSMIPRKLDHLEAARNGATIGLKAILVKDHHLTCLREIYYLDKYILRGRGVQLFGGVPLNNSVGGLNPYAVDLGRKMGAKIVWMPTVSAKRHILHHRRGKFPETSQKMLVEKPIVILTKDDQLKREVFPILEQIKDSDLILSAGHLSPAEIKILLMKAKELGIKRMVVNHPTFIINASDSEIKMFSEMGAFIEHSISMAFPESSFYSITSKELIRLIRLVGVEKTILGSDLGQVVNPLPVEGFTSIVKILLQEGLNRKEIEFMVKHNPAFLLNL